MFHCQVTIDQQITLAPTAKNPFGEEGSEEYRLKVDDADLAFT